jgi:hypothetical protein
MRFAVVFALLTALCACQTTPSPLSVPYKVRNQYLAIAIADERCGHWDESSRGKWRARYDNEVWFVWFDIQKVSGEPLLNVEIDARDGRVLHPCRMAAA